MLIWGAVWGGLLGSLWPKVDEAAGLILGALLGLAAGWSLRFAVRKEIAAAQQSMTAQALTAAAHMDAQADTQTAGVQAPAPVAASTSVAEDEHLLPDSFLDDLRTAVPAPPPFVTPPPAPSPATVQPAPLPPTAPSNWFDQTLAAVRQWFVQGNPIVRIGLVILFIGLSFLARYAAQIGLFPVELRLAAIGAAGVALLAVGFRQRTAKPAFGLVLQGGGVAALYLTVFAAFRLYQLMPQLAAFAFMVLVCAFSCALALLQNARALAFAAFAGGFAVPLLLSTGGGSHVGLFSYFMLLNLAILFIATRRAWRELNVLAFIATFGVFGLWSATHYAAAEHYASAQAFLAAFIAIFIATALLYGRATPLRLKASVSAAVDGTLVFGTPLAGFGLQAELVHSFEYGAAFSALVFGAVYLPLAALLLRRGAHWRLMAECFLALGVGFVTLAVPLALDMRWSSAVWALEGAAAFWAGMRQARWMPRAFGLALQLLALVCFLGGLADLPPSPWPLAHAGFMGAVVIALPALAIAWWTRRALPHSGSRWARGYATLEALLPTPLLLYALPMWLLAWWLEAARLLPSPQAGQWPQPAWQPLWGHWLLAGVTLLTCAALLQWALRARWLAAAWPSRWTLPALLLALLTQWGLGEGRHVTDWPSWLCWPLALALHVWLLRRNERAGSHLLTPACNGWISWQHTGTAWLAALLIGDALTGWATHAQLWGTDWMSVTSVAAATAVLLLLTRWAGRANRNNTRTRLGWPLNPHGAAYYWRAAAPLALLLWLGAFALAFTSSGHTAPLPYIPIVNPTDLALLLALGALLLWRSMALAAEPRPSGVTPLLAQPVFWGALGLLALVIISTVWLRVAHHYFAVPWSAHSLYESFVVQTGYAIVWTLLALALMVTANRRALRPAWLAGAALLALVVVKLFLVDLSNRGGGERIVSFIVVGVLILVVGYFAPLPPKERKEVP